MVINHNDHIILVGGYNQQFRGTAFFVVRLTYSCFFSCDFRSSFFAKRNQPWNWRRDFFKLKYWQVPGVFMRSILHGKWVRKSPVPWKRFQKFGWFSAAAFQVDGPRKRDNLSSRERSHIPLLMALVSGICDRFLEGCLVWLFSLVSFFSGFDHMLNHIHVHHHLEGFLGFLFPSTEEANLRLWKWYRINILEYWLVQWSFLVPFIGGR